MDIRRYFSPVGSKKSTKPASSAKETKKRNVIVESDEDEPVEVFRKKPKVLASDSEEDEIFSKSTTKTPKAKEEKSKRKSLPKPETPKLKPANVADFFGNSPVARKEETLKRKKGEESSKEVNSDDDFEKTLDQLDKEKEGNASKKHKQHHRVSPSTEDRIGKSSALPERKQQASKQDEDDFEKTLQHLDRESQALKKTPKQDSRTPSLNEDKPKPNENSPPNKIENKGGLASKLAAKFREQSNQKGILGEKKTPSKDKNENENEEARSIEKKKHGDVTPGKSKKVSDDLEVVLKKEIYSEEKDTKNILEKDTYTPKKEGKVKREKESLSEKKKLKNEKKSPGEEKTPNKEGKNKQEKDKLSSSEEKKPKEGKQNTENSKDADENKQIEDPDEKKKQARASYMKFLRRSGPSNPGSKPIPEGEPGCLQGLVFVISGVMDSLDREEATELIKKYGGKVTTSVSRNTSYLILGNEAGESKLKKAEQLGTKRLDEDGLLELISTRPGKGPQPESTKKGQASSKLKAFERDPIKSSDTPVSGSPVSKKSLSQDFSSSSQTPSPKKLLTQSQGTPKSEASGSPSSSTSSPSTQPLSSQDLADRPSETLMWVDKYKPSNIKNIIGQQGDKSNVKKLLTWLRNWKTNQFGNKKPTRPSPWAKDDNGAFFKAALLSGPPGVGKTTTAHLVCREAGFSFVELNASDARSKRTLDEVISEMLSNKNLTAFSAGTSTSSTSDKHALVMDEVDGMSGNEDRGGVQELITLIKKSKVPIIAMCNDRNHPKIRSLANHCFDLRFYKPRIEQIRGPMMSICFREGIKIKPDGLDQIIMGANQDVRQILHHLSLWSANQHNLQADDMKREAQKAKKDFKLGPWDVCKKVFSESDHKNMSIYDKSDLFFHDYSIAPLFVQENYPKAVPHCSGGNRRKTLEQLAKAAMSIADGDLVERAIRSKNAWSLLPTQAVFSSVFPGEYMSGHLSGQIEFPKWLGNNSRRNKFDRLMQELQMHMRLQISGSKLDVGMDYCMSLRNAITKPLAQQGADGIADAVGKMTSYDLLREDLEALMELSDWPGAKNPMTTVDSKVKAAFTRAYNKESHLSPYAAGTITKKKRGKGGGGEDEMYGEEEEEESDEEEDITADAMIKMKKGGPKKDGEAGGSKGRGRAGGSKGGGGGSGKGRGKGKN